MQSALPSQSAFAQVVRSFEESLPGKATLVVAASLFVAICAHISLVLPFTPVPITLQTFAVILIGMVLGPVAGFSALALYLAEGAAGLPVFNPHEPGGIIHLIGPNAGFLFSYPLVAAVAGWVTRGLSSVESRFTRAVAAGVAASVVVFAFGAGWLAHFAHLSAPAAWHLAIAPFLPAEAIKITAAAGIFSSLQRWTRA
ncbi:biotin transporter BioY [Edaphobacter bradus]|uniref:biotin transporter BioY n=1 Tax=Edaphobacter bradus TaxID=2259016 RepID=UPI0021DFF55A|nr:biotin transporter BioY [Edaphobacter bradus]